MKADIDSKNRLALILLLAMIIVGIADAADVTFIWTGNVNNSWWNTGNWSNNGGVTAVPNSTSSYNAFAHIGKESFVNPLIITNNTSVQTYVVDMGIGGTDTTVNIIDCNILCSGNFRQNWGDGTQSSTINMTGGYIETGTGAFMLNCDGRAYYCSLIFNMSGGHIKVNSWWFDTFQEETKPGITDVNISGTARIDTRGLFVGERGQSTMTVSGNAVINCDELFIKGYNASYNGLVAPELIVNSSLPITTPCITVNDTLSLHQDAGADLAKSTGTGKLTINSGCVKCLGVFRFGNIGEATLTMTGGKLDIAGDIQCGINAANKNFGYPVRGYLSDCELWANNIVDYGNADTKIYLSGNAAIYLRNPDTVSIQGLIDNGTISALDPNEKVSLVGGWPVPKIVIENNLCATDPNYGYGQMNVPIDAALTWSAAPEAVSHHIYFGTDPNAIANASTSSPEYKGSQTATSFVPFDGGHLRSSTIYYWRIDEEFEGGTVNKGNVWFFTTPICNHQVNNNGDCYIDFYDFCDIANKWLQDDSNSDDFSDWRNVWLLAQEWLQQGPFFDPYAQKLAAYWQFDAQTGAYAVDSVSGASDPINKGYHGVNWRKGVVGNALDLDGSFTYVLRPPIRVPALTDEFTVEGWFGVRAWPVNNTSGSADFASFLSCYNDSNGLRFGLNKFGDWGVKICQSGQWNEYWSPNKMPMMQWSHLAVTFDRNSYVKLYQNGELVATWSAVNASFSLPYNPLRIGVDNVITYSYDNSCFPNNLFNGLIDELKIFHRVLSQDEISKSYSDTRPVIAKLTDIEVSSKRFANDIQRPRYHAMPPANWTNEMHGLIYYQGKYHLFYQANPDGVFIQNQRWGHLTSDDLVHWSAMPLILCPESDTSIDRWGCWSGSVVEQNNQLKLIYTPVNSICARVGLATMNGDGISATRYSGNPVIGTLDSSSPYKDFRDPFVWKTGDMWYLIIGTGLDSGGGTALLYRSSDLMNWVYLKPILSDDYSSFWEIPTLTYLGNDKYLLYTCKCDPYVSSYWIGTWQNETFTPDDSTPLSLDPFEKYCTSHNHQIGASPCIDKDGKIVTMHIINDCRSEAEHFSCGWAHNFSLPREWFLRSDNTLGQRPYSGLSALRGTHDVNASNISVDTDGTTGLPVISGDMIEIEMTVDMLNASVFGIKLRESPDEQEVTVIEYQKDANMFVFDMQNSSLSASAFDGTERGDFVLVSGEKLQLHFFLDKSMIEMFVNERQVFTARVYPTRTDSQLVDFFTEGGSALIEKIDVWEITP